MTRTILYGTLVAAAALALGACANESDSEPIASDDASLETGCESGLSRSCEQTVDPAASGVQVCLESEDGRTRWTKCEPYYESVGSTPLVLAFARERVQFVASERAFDFDARGVSAATDWPTAATPWLALDRNGNGRIDDGSELFGSGTQLSGGRAPNGFVALAELDDDGDGRITPRDAIWSRLLVWSDRDASRTSEAGELAPLTAHGVEWIEVDYVDVPRCDARRNCERERARFGFRSPDGASRTGVVVDVHLGAQ
jgi:hypothetical protein